MISLNIFPRSPVRLPDEFEEFKGPRTNSGKILVNIEDQGRGDVALLHLRTNIFYLVRSKFGLFD